MPCFHKEGASIAERVSDALLLLPTNLKIKMLLLQAQLMFQKLTTIQNTRKCRKHLTM
uniref:Uncharacterized protein n=1 Tax=Brassica oleracea TaxID=3712 RepID=A0A3P6EIC4_BRAOL|nr:unnamed protein product [Brassica oleracea]